MGHYLYILGNCQEIAIGLKYMQNRQDNSETSAIKQKFLAQKIQFFEAILDLLPFHDWNKKLMLAAEKKCQFSLGYYKLLFPRGLGEVISELSAWQDQEMIDDLTKLNIQGRTKEKIAIAIYRRIILNSKISHIKYMSYFISTASIGLASSLAWQTCSKIWYIVGDKAVDFNYYTKRGLLLSVYASAITFYASDESAEDNETKQFINDSLDFITNLAKIKNIFKLPKIENIPFLRLL